MVNPLPLTVLFRASFSRDVKSSAAIFENWKLEIKENYNS